MELLGGNVMSDYPGLDHLLTVTLNADGDLVHKITCHAPEGALCRITCDDGCEEFEFEGHEHLLIDSGECMPLVYLENYDENVREMYDGDVRPLTADGPVTLNYHSGDYFVSWRYADDSGSALLEPQDSSKGANA